MADNAAADFRIARSGRLRAAQSATLGANAAGRLKDEVVPVTIPQRKGDPVTSTPTNIHVRTRTWKRSPAERHHQTGAVETAGNASGVNDGAAALIVASAEVKRHGLTPIARVCGTAGWRGVAHHGLRSRACIEETDRTPGLEGRT